MTVRPDRAEVLVVGAGPAGLTAACELARRGLRVRVVDMAARPRRAGDSGGAVALHPRTLETLDQMGLAGPLLAQGRHVDAFTLFAGGRRLVRLAGGHGGMPTRFPFTLVIGQPRAEALLRKAARRFGVRVEWGVRLLGFAQSADGDTPVRVRLAHADGREEAYEADWLVGCDGRHSTVRRQLGLPLLGQSAQSLEIVDAPVAGAGLDPGSIHWVHTDGQALLMLPYARDGHWRLLHTAAADAAADLRPPAQRFSQKLSAGLGREVRVGEPEWSSVLAFRRRMATRMRVGRCFLVGDAAHVHSPAAGQGVNTGIQEAYNLAWKLAMVERGSAGRALLDTYEAERLPVCRALLGSQTTHLLGQLAGLVLPAVMDLVRGTGLMHRAIGRTIQRNVLDTLSGPEPGYPTSPLNTRVDGAGLPGAGSRAAVPPAGAADPGTDGLRAELRDPRWSLLYVPEGTGEAVDTALAAREQHRDWLSVRTVALGGGPAPLADPEGRLREGLGLAAGSWLLIRPDGYVAAGGRQLTTTALDEALRPLDTEPVRSLAPLTTRRAG
ncbi:FAD-dependent oxidoreductase [Streptomyces sp. NPDC044571]|uniref:FAD-dependent oxidoreductase n=1 Tax=Streptomyces sp. NPDC044571 TaxID=3155371 RepID=UPI0033F4A6FA